MMASKTQTINNTINDTINENSSKNMTDDRLRPTSLLVRLLRKPETGAIAGTVVVFLFFLVYADPRMFSLGGILSFLEPAAQLGILAIAAALLMIGGEFDLGVGSMIAFGGVLVGVPLVVFGWPLEICVIFAFAIAICIGCINAGIVLRTGLPSFIVTLAFLYVLRGLSLIVLRWATDGNTQLRGLTDAIPEGHWMLDIFSGNVLEGLFLTLAEWGWIDTFKSGLPKVQGIPVEIVWFISIACIATFVLLRTKFGNWIFAVGGDPIAARNSGVPIVKVKLILFSLTAIAATLVGIMNGIDFGSTDASRGQLKEFEAIIVAVIGGCLLTGGYGSAIGPFFGAIIFGMVSIGISYTDINQDWFKVFLGAMLLIAVLFNNYIRRKAVSSK